MNKVTIEQIPIETGPCVIDWVLRLFSELGEEMDDLGSLNEGKVLADWQTNHDRFHVFAAKDERGDLIGLLTLAESFAIYANGSYGIINEMYVSPAHRGVGVGAMLLNAAKEFGRQKDWARIEVTAPESPRWVRTRLFYEKQGFVFTGPKLKFRLGSNSETKRAERINAATRLVISRNSTKRELEGSTGNQCGTEANFEAVERKKR